MPERIIHFIFGLRPQDEPFHLLHYLAIESCRRVLAPDEIRLHLFHLPYGVYWDLARPLVQLHRVEPIAEVDAVEVDPMVARYRHAHHSDVIRLDVLARDGGMYADIDTLFVRPVPEHWWDVEALIGREAPVQYSDRSDPEPSVSNALMMARPGSDFITTWRDQIVETMDGTWSEHSCRLATRLAEANPESVLVVDKERFSPFDHTPEGVSALLEEPMIPGALDRTYSVHLCAHLWWEQDRTDFSRFSAAAVTEDLLRETDTPLATLARPFLPDHGLF
ncbi:MAG: glycosyltransferase [Acidimicrobiales bacterium]